MRDIWNPWHGCKKISEGCTNCYMYYLDKIHKKDGSNIYKTKNGFTYPLHKDRVGNYKIKSGEMIRVCMTSDFFIEEADPWRDEAWEIMKTRSDIKFFLLTKRPERVKDSLPKNWGNGWENIFFNITCETQKLADKRIPILHDLPFKHKGIMAAPLLGRINIEKYLKEGQIEQVIAGGENYENPRPCDFEWIKSLRSECEKHNITFCFIETGTNFIKDKKRYYLPDKIIQSRMAFKSGMSYKGKEIEFLLSDESGRIDKKNLYTPYYCDKCLNCGSKIVCNGCSKCGKCEF